MTPTDAMTKCGGLGAATTFAEILDGSYRYPSRYFFTGNDISCELVCSDTSENSVELARSLVSENESCSPGAAIAYDTILRFQGEQFDAVIIEMQTFGGSESRYVVALPYSMREDGQVTTYRPKVLSMEHVAQHEAGAIFDTFFSWFASSEHAYVRWKAGYVG